MQTTSSSDTSSDTRSDTRSDTSESDTSGSNTSGSDTSGSDTSGSDTSGDRDTSSDTSATSTTHGPIPSEESSRLKLDLERFPNDKSMIVLFIGSLHKDAYTYKDYLKYSSFLIRKTHVQHILLDYKIIIRDYDQLVTVLETRQNKIIFVFYSDIYQLVCRYSLQALELKARIDYLNQKWSVLPNSEFMYQCGTKLYALSLKNEMLPGTLIFPNDKEEIERLKTKKYMIKFGLTSSSRGTIVFSGDGKGLLTKINELTKEKRSLQCGENIVIIQPFFEKFEHCFEYRIFVINNKIYGIGQPSGDEINHGMDLAHINQLLKLLSQSYYLNPHILSKANSIIEYISSNFSNNLFARIDIVVDCNRKIHPDLNYQQAFDTLFGTFNHKIYLNEIEPLGSGFKDKVLFTLQQRDERYKLIDNMDAANIYDQITKNILIAGLRLSYKPPAQQARQAHQQAHQQVRQQAHQQARQQAHRQTGGRDKECHYTHKKCKYKSKYLKLKYQS